MSNVCKNKEHKEYWKCLRLLGSIFVVGYKRSA